MNNRCAGIVTYNPDLERLNANIASIYPQVSELFVFDNGSNNISGIESLTKEYGNITIIKNDINRGIAFALNSLCDIAFKNNYLWILTLDQDSICDKDLVKCLLGTSYDAPIGIVSPVICYHENDKNNKPILSNTVDSVEWCITSGSLTNLNAWREIGGFDNDLFIDLVDCDFCLRLKSAGYRIVRNNNVVLWHELGNLKTYNLFGNEINVTNHTPWRYYYISRNSFILKKKISYGHPIINVFKITLKITLFERNKCMKMKNVIKGVLDSYNYNHSR